MFAQTGMGKSALFGLKILIAFVLLYWLYRQGGLDFTPLLQLNQSDGFLLSFVGAIALILGALLILSVRLVILLDVQGITVSLRRCIGLTMVGAFFGAIVPGLVGGDAVKALYLLNNAEGKRSKAVAAVIVDRALGLYALLLLSTFASLAAWYGGWLHGKAQLIVVIAPTLIVGTTLAMIILVGLHYQRGAVANWVKARLPRVARNVTSALVEYVRQLRRLAHALVLSVISHAMVVVAFFVMAMLLRDSLTLGQHFALDPLAMLLNVVPLTPGGLGIAEGAFSYLFKQAGSPNGAIVGLLGRAVQYIAFTAGGLLGLLDLRFKVNKPSANY